LPNRDLFLNRLSQSITRSKKEKDFDFAVLFFDIDNFKIVNDSLGHSTGDKLLVAIAERLNHNVRDIDTVIARFGGDEFAILLDDVKESLFAVATANRLREILSRPYNINEKQIFSGVSIGVATSTIGYDHPEDILQDADIAMYQAKELRKARVEIYNKSMRDRALERMHMVTALKQGALQKEFRLHYQPVISLQTGRVAGFEALLRWYTPNRGILNPADFIDMIDTAGLIYSTDHWALQNACRQATEWQNKFPSNPPLFIAANLSARNIKHPNLVDNINQVLQETKLEPDRLWLEITEKVSAPDDEGAIEVLKKLRSTGVRISIDDFDTGYSALNYLARFPVDVLKIDKSFVQMIGQEDDSQKIIEMIKALANHLGLTVIAEGVETAEQIPFLQSINCEYAQGFFYAKPLDAQAATELLANRHSW
jgi:diguanylate cyclase (GGDEF)-like protein